MCQLKESLGATTYVSFPRPPVHCSDQWRGVGASPCWLWQGVSLFGVSLQEMLDRTGVLLEIPRHVEHIHFVVSLSHFVWQAAGPRLDLVEPEFLFVVPGFAEINRLVRRQTTGSAFRVTSDEHDKAVILKLLNSVVSVLASLDHLVFVEVLVVPMYRLLGSVVPARVHPSLTTCV